jgi:hypothetical protein
MTIQLLKNSETQTGSTPEQSRLRCKIDPKQRIELHPSRERHYSSRANQKTNTGANGVANSGLTNDFFTQA